MYRIFFLFIISTFSSLGFCFNVFPVNYISYRKIKDLYKDIYGNIYKQPNLEHVIPQSLLKKDNILKKDMHNILWYPSMLNNHRSNYKYSNDDTIYEKSIILDEEGFLSNNIYNPTINSIKTSNLKIFCPRTSLRGEISRSCLYFAYTYNKYYDLIVNEVIDKKTLVKWHEEYPVTELEEYKNYKIMEFQGNENIFISNPKYINDFIKVFF